MRLIDADALKKTFCAECLLYVDDRCTLPECDLHEMLHIDMMPTIEPERKKGTWVQISPAKIYECSECGQTVMTDDIDCYKFCHGCGADMRGEQDE